MFNTNKSSNDDKNSKSKPSLFKDLFSGHSASYSSFRPTYPPNLFKYLASLTPERDHAWDCGTGNGQAALALAEYFQSVLATDPSQNQLSRATPNPKVHYEVGTAENPRIQDHSLDLITCAQAIHWFKQDYFFESAIRVLKPNGILAFWCYGLPEINSKIDPIIDQFYSETLGPYWEPERRQVEEGYQKITLPSAFYEIQPSQKFEILQQWSLQEWLGYISTWSATQSYIKAQNKNPLEDFSRKLKTVWPTDQNQTIQWRICLRIARKKP